MRVLLLLALVLVCVSTLSAQYYSFKKPKGSFGFIVGTEMGTRHIEEGQASESFTDAVVYRERRQAKNTNLRLGVNYSKFLQTNAYIKTGLRLNMPAFISSILPTLPSETSTAFKEQRDQEIAETDIQGYRFKVRQYKAEIPLLVRYHFMSDKCAVFIEGGLSTEIYLGSTVNTTKKRSRAKVVQIDTDLINVQTVLSIGSEWNLAEELPLFIQMTARYNPFTYTAGGREIKEFGMGAEIGTRKYF